LHPPARASPVGLLLLTGGPVLRAAHAGAQAAQPCGEQVHARSAPRSRCAPPAARARRRATRRASAPACCPAWPTGRPSPSPPTARTPPWQRPAVLARQAGWLYLPPLAGPPGRPRPCYGVVLACCCTHRAGVALGTAAVCSGVRPEEPGACVPTMCRPRRRAQAGGRPAQLRRRGAREGPVRQRRPGPALRAGQEFGIQQPRPCAPIRLQQPAVQFWAETMAPQGFTRTSDTPSYSVVAIEAGRSALPASGLRRPCADSGAYATALERLLCSAGAEGGTQAGGGGEGSAS